MKPFVALLFITLFGMSKFATAREPEIVQLSPDTYLITKEDHGGIFGSLAKMKVKIIKQANGFAAKQGKIAIPLSSVERPLGHGPAQWASFEYQFRVVDKGDAEARRTSLTPRPEVVVAVDTTSRTPPAPVSSSTVTKTDEIYNSLLKLDDLRKRGLITDAEYETQKKRILSD
jgi:hypothetical protein